MSLFGIDPANPDEFKSHAQTLSPSQEQPTLPGMTADDVFGATPPSVVVKLSKKAKRQLKAMKRGGYTVTPAQRLMREEMTEPKKIGIVLDEEFGVQTDVSAAAAEVIEEHGQGLQLSLGQWAIVQRLVEQGIRLGQAD